MDSNLLIAAKKYEKERKWNKAIDHLDQIIDRTEGNCDAEVYIVYARCLWKTNNTNGAKEILKKGLEKHPKNEGILLEFLTVYELVADWQSSEQIALSLININSEKADYHFRLGRVYAFLLKSKEAEQAYKTGLKHKHQISFEKLTEKVQLGFTDDPSKVISEYSFIYGNNNLGIFTHEYGDQKFFTKIFKVTRTTKREETFYKEISSDFPDLKQIAPSYIDSKVIDNIMYLTIEMIDDDIPIKNKHTEKIITAASQISKIKYQDIIKKYPNPKYSFQFNDRPILILIFFTQIHEKYQNEMLFSSIYKFLEQKKYPEIASKTIQRLESLIMDNKLYLFIKPEEHYSLLHGDLHAANIKIKKRNENPVIFDWANFKIGPHFLDVAHYLSSKFIPYSEMKEIYLTNDERGKKISLIEKIFFLYAMVILYTISRSKKTIDERLSDFIVPAINDLDILVSQFKEDEFVEVVESLSIENKETQIRNKELNKKIETLIKETQMLKKENQNLQTEFNDMLNSKSWKVTAPLRKIIQLMENGKRK